MSSKLNVKAKGKEARPKSSDRLRKKRDGTPEKSATPSQEPDENLAPSRNVIWNDEIEKLQIKADDLPKQWAPQPPSTEKKFGTARQVTVQKVKKQPDMGKPKSRMVSVAKPAPPDAPVKPPQFSGFAGPKYDEQGEVITHSLLGTYEDFHREATRRGDLITNMPTPREEHGRADTPTVKYERPKREQKAKLSRDDNNALANWQQRMLERKRQQGYISKLLQKSPEDLAMNQADNFRKVQEQRYLVDRAIPGVDYGKGYRVGSEFWHQQEQFGDDLTGLHMTLTQAQRGYPPPVEHIGLPAVVKEEKGCEWLGRTSPHVNYPWHKSQFLEQRKKQLQPYMDEMDPWKPDFDGLQVIGSNKPFQGDVTVKVAEQEGDDLEYDAYLDDLSGVKRVEPFEGEDEEGKEKEEESERKSVLAQTEGEKAPVFGPSLLFSGQHARWTGDSFSYKNEVGIEARVTFEAFTGDRVTSFLELVNDGTTSIYYDWKKMSKDNPFDLVQKQVQRFYFNNASGVILPGETLRFPFVFKSPNAGVFSEQWNLETRPVVCGGAALLVTLRGVALQEDKFKEQREKLEKELVQRQAQQVVGQILYEMVSGIRTPERARSPVDAYITEEEIFRRNNPGLEYSHEHVAKLAEIYSQLFEEEVRAENVWSLSVADLQESILQLGEEEDEKKENLLHQMNNLVGQLTYIPAVPMQQRMHAAGYQLMSEAIDRMVGEALLLRHSMNLPDREQDDIDGEAHRLRSSDSRKGARAADVKGKGDASKDKGKGQAKDAKPAKGGGKAEGKGKAAAAATTGGAGQKKTPTPVSKSTAPTPAPTASSRVPTPGEREREESGLSHPGTPDPNVTSGSTGTSLNDSELALAEKLYRDSFTVQAYNILGEMLENMDTIFSALKEDPSEGLIR